MKRSCQIAVLLAGCLAGISAWHMHSAVARDSSSAKLAPPSKIIFWAWERPEDLRFLSNTHAGVAFLAKTIFLDSNARVTIRPRLQPLRVPPETPLVAVVRIEPRRGWQAHSPMTLSGEAQTSLLTNQIVSAIAELQNLPGVTAIQIDFDATTSEHSLYARLLTELRHRLPPAFPLSITALSSWCVGDSWLTRLPAGAIDNAVPMLFRMGRDAPAVDRFLRSESQFTIPSCRQSLGLSIDEPLSRAFLSATSPLAARRQNKQIYVFSPRPWTKASAETVLEALRP